MRFRELVDLVMLNVNGGQFSSESAVQEPDVASYVSQAAHTVIRNAVFGLKVDARVERGESGLAANTLDPGFFETYTRTVAYDDTRKVHYADLPGVIQSWPGDAAMQAVFAKANPSAAFLKLAGAWETANYGDLLYAMNVYWHEVYYSGDAANTRVFLPGLEDGACDIMIVAACEISPALGDTRVPIPVGLESMICQMAIEHFRGQRGVPADPIIDNNDVNAQKMQ